MKKLRIILFFLLAFNTSWLFAQKDLMSPDIKWTSAYSNAINFNATGIDICSDTLYVCGNTPGNGFIKINLINGDVTNIPSAFLNTPHGLRIYNEYIWLTDLENHQVYKVNLDGEVIMSIGEKGVSGCDKTHFFKPTDVAIATNGNIYVTDGYGNSRVVCLNAEGRFLFEWGEEGNKAGQFKYPHSIIIHDNRVYIADRANKRIQIFSMTGEYITEWKQFGKVYGMYSCGEHLYICRTTSDLDSIIVSDYAGRKIAEYGSHGDKDGQFDVPHELVVSSNYIYVAEVKNQRVQRIIKPALHMWAQESIMNGAFVINEDNSHFFFSRGSNEMTIAGLNAFVDQYANTKVTHLFLCPNAMRTSFRSNSREAIWDGVGSEVLEQLDGKTRCWIENAHALAESGLDPYAIWIKRCRDKGISPWLSMRMNDIHNVNITTPPGDVMHSSFWRNHPEYWRVPNCKPSAWQNRALNYAFKDVRIYNLNLVKELLERYDPDGLELDWMRFGYHLTPGKEREESYILTQFIRDVRKLTVKWGKKRGHFIYLAVRIPSHPDAAAGLGMDGVLWAKEGLVDVLVPAPFWFSSDFDIPVELWKMRMGDAAARTAVLPGLESSSRSWPGGKPVSNDLSIIYGFAAAANYRGADGLYFFNLMDDSMSTLDYRTFVEKGIGADVAYSGLRRFPVCYRDTVPKGVSNDVALPIDSQKGGSFKIYIGSCQESEKVLLALGLMQTNEQSASVLKVEVNGKVLKNAGGLGSCENLLGNSWQEVCFKLPVDVLTNGYNFVEIKPELNLPKQEIVWAEIRLFP